MIVINVEKFGDFDTPYTIVSMVGPAGMDKKTAKMLAKEAEELAKNTNDEEGTIKFLKSWGFTCANTIGCTIGGNL